MPRTELRPLPAWLLLASLLLFSLLVQARQAPEPAPAVAAAAPGEPGLRIGVVTMEPGEIFFERFGHNAIVVLDDRSGQATSYNFGFFDLEEPGFMPNFIRGRMEYLLVDLPLDFDLAGYARSGRGVGVQWLDLSQAQARRLSDKLADNARPGNARYTYDYYTSNCSTKVRDAIDEVLGGTLRTQLTGRSQGNTYRSESVRLASPAAWMGIGFHVGLGDFADRPLSRWDESFIPMRLRDALDEVRLADGRPLVIASESLLPHRIGQPPEEAPRLRVPALFAGLALAIGVLWLGRRAPRALAAGALAFWTVAGLAGLTMAFIWIATSHVAGHGNENLLLLSPLCLTLLPGAWARLRGREPGPVFLRLLRIVVACAAIAGFLKFLPFRAQENVEWVLLLLPLHLALLRAFDPRR